MCSTLCPASLHMLSSLEVCVCVEEGNASCLVLTALVTIQGTVPECRPL